MMDKNKMIAGIIGIVLAVAGTFLGFNLKDAVCGAPIEQSQPAQGK